MSDKVTPFPVKVRDNSKQVVLASPHSGCQHRRAIVDPKLLELECADCNAKLNPIHFLVMLANLEAAYEWKQEALQQQRKKIEERSRCRCTKCGEWTEIRRVGRREVERIKRAVNATSARTCPNCGDEIDPPIAPGEPPRCACND